MTGRFEELAAENQMTLEAVNAAMLIFFREREGELKKVFSVRSEDIDLRQRLKELCRQYIVSTSTALGERERDIMAEITVIYLLSSVSGGAEGDFSTSMLSSWLDLTV